MLNVVQRTFSAADVKARALTARGGHLIVDGHFAFVFTLSTFAVNHLEKRCL